MEYIFKDKTYKVSKFKTFLTNQLKKESIEIVYQYLKEFIENNLFEYFDMVSILNRYIEYSRVANLDDESIYDYVRFNLNKIHDIKAIENILSTSRLFYQINLHYSLNYLEENINKIPNNTKEKVQALILKSDLLVERKDFDGAFSVLRDGSNQSIYLYIFDSLELKRTIYEKMSIIGELEGKVNVAINYYIYYCAFQAGLEFLHFPYLEAYKNFRLTYSIVENPEDEIVQINKHLENKNIDINLFNNFLRDFYKIEIPVAFKLENFDILAFNVSELPIKELTYYSSYLTTLNVGELVSKIEFLTSQKIKKFF